MAMTHARLSAIAASLLSIGLLGAGCVGARDPGAAGDPAPIPPGAAPPGAAAPPPGAPSAASQAPITGGTLLVAEDGVTAVVADPARDRVWIVDLTGRAVL